MHISAKHGWAACAFILLSACADSGNYAPVADVSGYEAVPKTGAYRVQAGDTLYSIAWRYGSDYRDLAQYNHIPAPYSIHTGQSIYLRQPSSQGTTEPAQSLKVVEKPVTPIKTITKQPSVKEQYVAESKEPAFEVSEWVWPAQGRIIALYSRKNKGIDISGHAGENIFASGPGKVVYAGNGLRGYGNLLIIKHNSQYLSAYAYNKQLVVKEGQMVKRGQKIATMGQDSNGKTMLHFEIRKAGSPINPLNLLNK